MGSLDSELALTIAKHQQEIADKMIDSLHKAELNYRMWKSNRGPGEDTSLEAYLKFDEERKSRMDTDESMCCGCMRNGLDMQGK